MVRYMADSINCHQFAKTVTVPGVGLRVVSLTAGYLPPSRYAASSQACGGTDVKIDVAAVHPEADVLDIEIGDATPSSAPAWVIAHNRIRRDYPGILYCNRSTATAVANALRAANLVVVRDYRWWIATLDGTRSVVDMTGVTAVQAWSANYFPDNIDLSVVYDDAWKSSASPPPVKGKADDMFLVLTPSHGIWAIDGSGYHHVAEMQTVHNMQAAGIGQYAISDAEHSDWIAAQLAISTGHAPAFS